MTVTLSVTMALNQRGCTTEIEKCMWECNSTSSFNLKVLWFIIDWLLFFLLFLSGFFTGHQNCTRCQRKFPIIEYGDGCFYHSEKPILFEKNSVGTSASANLGVTPTTQSPAVPASPKSCKAWQRSKEETSKGQDKVMHREDKQNTHNLWVSE